MWTSPSTSLDLDWPRVLDGLAAHARSGLGKQACRTLPLLDDASAIASAFDELDEAANLLRLNTPPPSAEIYDIEQELRAAERGSGVPGLGLLNVAYLMRGMMDLRGFALKIGRAAPRFSQRASLLMDLSSIAANIERSIDERGEITNDASSALGRMRQQALQLHDEVVRDLDKLVVELAESNLVTERFVTLRNDRFVIPVKSSEQSRVPGILHDSSQTGYTVFIEPEIAVERGNKLKFLRSRIEEEERRILRELSTSVAGVASDLRKGLAALIAADVWMAKAYFARQLKAERPQVVAATERVELKHARHPLLVMIGTAVIPNDIVFAPQEHCLVLTGPNTGGKTAALKCVGLCALMTRAGLFIPASDSSRIPLYSGIFSVIGDNQSIERSLSTFGNHIKEIQMVIERSRVSDQPCLILLDEICADTDPRLGAALARAVLEAMVDTKATVVVTTHYSDLATLATKDPHFATAAFGFDYAALRPTYRLDRGALGASSPLEIAGQLGLDKRIIDNARTYTDPSVAQETSMRAELERLQKEVLGLREQAVKEQLHAQEDRRQAEKLRKQAALEHESAKQAASKTLGEELQKAQDSVRQAVKRLQAGFEQAEASGETAQAMRIANEVRDTLANEAKNLAPRHPVTEQAEVLPIDKAHYRVGQQVLARGLMGETPGEIVSIDIARGEATVSLGALRVRQSLDALRPARPGAKPSKPETTRSSVKQKLKEVEPEAQSLVRADGRVDLRGGRVDDALRELDRALDIAIKEQRPRLTIVHGHGTGALKGAVREYLSFSHYVRSYRPGDDGEGRDGVTIVEL